jgi:hypothetical protein
MSTRTVSKVNSESQKAIQLFVKDFDQAWERARCDKTGERPLIFKVKWYQELKAQAELLDTDPHLLESLAPAELHQLDAVVEQLGELPDKPARKNSRHTASYYRAKAIRALELLLRKSQHHDDFSHEKPTKSVKQIKEEEVVPLIQKLNEMFNNVVSRIEAYSKALAAEEVQQERVIMSEDPDSILNTRRLSTASDKINRYESKLLELGQIHNDLNDCLAIVSAKKASWKEINSAIKTLHGRWVGSRRSALFSDPELYLLLEDVVQENRSNMEAM